MPPRLHTRSAPAATGLARALPAVLAGDGLTTHFQPIVDLQRRTVVGHEALLRFPGETVSSPAAWIEAAHLHGCGAELEAAALRSALAARSRLPAGAFLSVNVAPAVLSHPAVREAFRDPAGLTGVVVELTEHSKVDHYGSLAPELDRLRAAGAVIAVDDTGAGYAGMQHLLSIRPEMIKLDRTLIAGIDRDRPQQALVEMFRAFANRFDAWVVAEGVETPAELATLRRLGVPLAQGFLLARPACDWQELSAEAEVHLRALATEPAGPTLRLLVEPAAASARAGRRSGRRCGCTSTPGSPRPPTARSTARSPGASTRCCAPTPPGRTSGWSGWNASSSSSRCWRGRSPEASTAECQVLVARHAGLGRPTRRLRSPDTQVLALRDVRLAPDRRVRHSHSQNAAFAPPKSGTRATIS